MHVGTIDHENLLNRLATDAGVTGIALSWFRSSLSNLTQAGTRADHLSSYRSVICGVLQGSVLEPLLYCIYTRPLEQIIEPHKTQYHFYANDTQLYLSFDPCDAQSAIARLNSCLVDIRAWMKDNFLKLNDDKTELILIGNPKRVAKIHNFQLPIFL